MDHQINHCKNHSLVKSQLNGDHKDSEKDGVADLKQLI